MIHLTIVRGNLKETTSIEKLKNDLCQLLKYEPRLSIDDNLNIKGYIAIGSGDNFTESDILKIMVNHCTNFKIEIDEDDFFNREFFYSYFTWDGINLIEHYKNMFGTIDEIENWNWVFQE